MTDFDIKYHILFKNNLKKSMSAQSLKNIHNAIKLNKQYDS